LCISLEETTFARRGFNDSDAVVRERLECVGRAFLHGYHEALKDDDAQTLAERLNTWNGELRGFAFEGASMGLTLLDHLSPRRKNRFRIFLDGPATAHSYMVHVGVGWAIARLPWLRRKIDVVLAHFDPLLRWLTVDGYGFHEGYFHWPRSVEGQKSPTRLSAYALRVFDQGLGRSLWFVDGADAHRIPVTIGKFAPSRQADLWSGVGLACAYAGGVDRNDIEALQRGAGSYRPQLAQGAAFAAKARQRAGNPSEHTELACRTLCRLSADEAATITDAALEDLPADGREPAYEVWRKRIQATFATDHFL
jgi:hypothetical protein